MKGIFLLFGLFIGASIFAQDKSAIVAGPMLGYIELRTARIWCEVSPQTEKVSISFRKSGSEPARSMVYTGRLKNDFNPVIFELTGLEINTQYQYEIIATTGQQSFKKQGNFTTTDLWQYRKNAPDFSFLTGSCAFFNEAKYDRVKVELFDPHTPAKPYGGDSTIFETMAREKAAFNIWLGDNWYYREVDYGSPWGLNYRASITRKLSVLQNLMKAMPQYAIWDDHDYGPDNSDQTYPFKHESLDIFKKYWANPGYGDNGEGIYTNFSYSDVDFFMMDDRWFRSNDELSPTVEGKPNPGKRMWGPKQMEWLKNGLRGSSASFKIIVTGSQSLNPVSAADCLQSYPIEFNELMGFLNEEKISGVVFFTGDRHHSEVIRYERPGLYALYDVTSSPLTSGVSRVRGNETNNPARVSGTLVEAQNYTRVSVSGPVHNRLMKIEFVGIKGETLAQWSVSQKELAAKE